MNDQLVKKSHDVNTFFARPDVLSLMRKIYSFFEIPINIYKMIDQAKPLTIIGKIFVMLFVALYAIMILPMLIISFLIFKN